MFEHLFELAVRWRVTSTPILHPTADRGRPASIDEWKERAMRQYDDLVEVRKGPVPGYGADGPGSWPEPFADVLTLDPADPRSQVETAPDGPQQFLWQGRLWQVREVIAHWMEVGAWWLRRPEDQPGRSELVREREVWRVTAARGRAVATPDDPGFGVFDLAFDPAGGVWRLAAALD